MIYIPSSFLIIGWLSLVSVFAQTGPGGVGDNAANVQWLRPAAGGIWVDLSGNNRAITGPNGGVFVPNAINGRPVIRFDGSTNFYTSNYIYTARTAFFIFRPSSTSQDTNDLAQLWGQYNNPPGFHVAIDARNPGQWSFDGGGNSQARVALNGGNFSGFAQNTDANPWSYNNNLMATVEFQADGNLTEQMLGRFAIPPADNSDMFYGGDMAEVAVFNRVLNTTERIIVENYLSATYAITLTTTPDYYAYDNLGTPGYDHSVAGVGQTGPGDRHLVSNSSIIRVDVSGSGSLDDNDFLHFGHNNAALTYTTTNMPADRQGILRAWRFDERGSDIGNVTVTVNVGNFPGSCSGVYYAFLDADGDGDFSNATVLPLTLVSGTNYSFTTNIPNGATLTFGTDPQLTLTAAATGNAGEGALTWTQSALGANFQAYRIYAGTSPNPATVVSTITDINTLNQTLTGLTNCVTHFVRIRGVNTANNEVECSNEASFTPTDPGIVPPALTLNTAAAVPAQGRIEINFSGSADANFQNYNIYAYPQGSPVPATPTRSSASVSATTQSFTFAATGTYCFRVAQVNRCANQSPLSGEQCATITTPGEICDDEIDNDGDGLIDCYDVGDCSGFLGCPQPRPECEFDPNNNNNAVVELDRIAVIPVAGSDIGYSTPLAGDVDGDGVIELVVLSRDGIISVIDATALIVERTLSADPTDDRAQALSMADVDRNGFADLFYKNSSNQIVRYQINNSGGIDLVWRNTTNLIPDRRPGSLIADIDGNGTPEVIIAGKIYNSLTGAFLGQIPAGSDNGAPREQGGAAIFHSTSVFDVLPTAQCAACGGQEILAGNAVYAVDPTTNPWTITAQVTVETAPGSGTPCDPTVTSGTTNCPIRDGVITIADIDGDGDLDGVSSGYGRFFVWDLQTSAMLSQVYDLTTPGLAPAPNATWNTSSPFSSPANLDDFDGDGRLEIALSYRYGLGVFDYDPTQPINNRLAPLWQRGTTDESGTTVVSSFDFLGTDTAALVYRDETTIYAYKGLDGAEFYNSQAAGDGACNSGTGMEGISIGDFTGNNETEIAASCNGSVRLYRSGNFPWVPSRGVWNQTLYNVVNVNDNLTIPASPQNPTALSFLNKFMFQRPLVDDNNQVVIPATDLNNSLNGISSAVDGGGQCVVNFTVTISNQGSRGVLTNYPISIYRNDPRTNTATLLQTQQLTTNLPVGGSTTFAQVINLGVLNPTDTLDLFLSVNDTGATAFPAAFPRSPLPECDYSNNIVGPSRIVNCANIPLPVSFLSFEAYPQSDYVRLVWQTSTEQNNAFFTIERSHDGRSFQPLGQVSGHGTTSDIHRYLWDDNYPLPGLSYYRLRQTDLDGQTSYTKIRAVRFEGQQPIPQIILYPQPTSVQTSPYLRYQGIDDVLRWTITDASGRTYGSGIWYPTGGVVDAPLPVRLSAGIYFLRLTGSQTGQHVRKLVVH